MQENSVVEQVPVSAILNNCLLHAVTPELVQEIAAYAQDEHRTHAFKAGYDLFKQCFAEYYVIQNAAFTWTDFNTLLLSLNPIDQQIVLGPVLRQFMASRYDAMTENKALLSLIIASLEDHEQSKPRAYFTAINSQTGRYSSLEPDPFYHFVAQPLGLSLKIKKEAQEQDYSVDKPLYTITLYHHGGIQGAGAGGHWERTVQKPKVSSKYLEETSRLKAIYALSGDVRGSSGGLELLGMFVRAVYRKNQQDQSDCLNIANDLEKYQEVCNQANTTLQIQLLEQYKKNALFQRLAKIYSPNNDDGLLRFSVEKPKESDQPSEDKDLKKNYTSTAYCFTDRHKAPLSNATPHECYAHYMAQLALKIEDLENRRDKHLLNSSQYLFFNHAVCAAQKIHTDISKAKTEYDNNPTEPGCNNFKKAIRDTLFTNRDILDQHRGWSAFLTNLALGIMTAGIGLLVKSVVNAACRRPFFFVHKTQSATILDNISDTVRDISTLDKQPRTYATEIRII